jgi:hydrogenase maturation protease
MFNDQQKTLRENTGLKTKMVVLGLGNLLNSDDGFGVHAIWKARNELGRKYPQVEFIDGGTLGLNLLPLIEETTHLLLLDCVKTEQPLAGLIELNGDQIPLHSGIKISPHQTTFQEVLGLAKIRDRLPEEIHLIGAQPTEFKTGTELSPQLQELLPETVARVEAQLAIWAKRLA